MANSKTSKYPRDQKLDQIQTLLQDLFILEGLKAGMKTDDIREVLKIRRERVIAISKSLGTSKE